ncbi:MAG: energy transducer TonB [Nevskia sp.]|nr:energy transducer TonB [Nevskia sp.]
MRTTLGPFRFGPPMLMGLGLIVGMFWLLHALITHSGVGAGKSEVLPTIDFVRLKKSFEVETRERKPPPQLPEKEKAPEIPTQKMQVEGPSGNTVNIGTMKVDKDVAKNTGFALSASDGEYLPIVKVAPMYPESAASRGIEGYVLLEFTVTETGATADPAVLESQPSGIFDEAAKKAVLKFKYKPRVENGKPVRVEHVRHVITFKLDKK